MGCVPSALFDDSILQGPTPPATSSSSLLAPGPSSIKSKTAGVAWGKLLSESEILSSTTTVAGTVVDITPRVPKATYKCMPFVHAELVPVQLFHSPIVDRCDFQDHSLHVEPIGFVDQQRVAI
jgi:hypothetical protein